MPEGPTGSELPHTQTQIRRAGDRLRRAFERGESLDENDLRILNDYRAWHQPTLERCQHELVACFAGVDPSELSLSGRPLKTVGAILAKLSRSRTRLTRMQDIAGTRIVVADLDLQESTAEAVVSAFADRNGSVVKDTRANGDDYGYRAIHIVATLEGRLAEIQVRTVLQDAWAQIVESTDKTLGSDLKHGQGPADWVEWLLELSEALRQRDLGHPAAIPVSPFDRFIESQEDTTL